METRRHLLIFKRHFEEGLNVLQLLRPILAYYACLPFRVDPGSGKGSASTLFKGTIATNRKTLNWRAVLSSYKRRKKTDVEDGLNSNGVVENEPNYNSKQPKRKKEGERKIRQGVVSRSGSFAIYRRAQAGAAINGETGARERPYSQCCQMYQNFGICTRFSLLVPEGERGESDCFSFAHDDDDDAWPGKVSHLGRSCEGTRPPHLLPPPPLFKTLALRSGLTGPSWKSGQRSGTRPTCAGSAHALAPPPPRRREVRATPRRLQPALSYRSSAYLFPRTGATSDESNSQATLHMLDHVPSAGLAVVLFASSSPCKVDGSVRENASNRVQRTANSNLLCNNSPRATGPVLKNCDAGNNSFRPRVMDPPENVLSQSYRVLQAETPPGQPNEEIASRVDEISRHRLFTRYHWTELCSISEDTSNYKTAFDWPWVKPPGEYFVHFCANLQKPRFNQRDPIAELVCGISSEVVSLSPTGGALCPSGIILAHRRRAPPVVTQGKCPTHGAFSLQVTILPHRHLVPSVTTQGVIFPSRIITYMPIKVFSALHLTSAFSTPNSDKLLNNGEENAEAGVEPVGVVDANVNMIATQKSRRSKSSHRIGKHEDPSRPNRKSNKRKRCQTSEHARHRRAALKIGVLRADEGEAS
ncbi:hypothetical protein PR048_001174 [Dryococelus australis]|uniref:Uncharacterized protein n=1 Tax=Dryococelus australis TaxID=614101 RepID=A0ABQ9IGM9_9NEOP|nr:hypothetical protein PR048_001174 [Dryococelus australis]